LSGLKRVEVEKPRCDRLANITEAEGQQAEAKHQRPEKAELA
jgi:hypothetical protein